MINNLLYRHKNNPKTAIIAGNKSITYQDWYEKSYRLAIILTKKVNNGARIMLYMEEGIQYCIGYFAILFADCVVVPQKPSNTATEAIHKISDLQISLILTNDSNMNIKFSVFGCQILNIDAANSESVEHILNIDDDSAEQSNDPILILNTSGTSGKPKYAVLSRYNISSNVDAHIASVNISSDDIGLIALPIYFSYCNTSQFLSYVKLGMSFVIDSKSIYPSAFINIVKSEHITVTNVTPPILDCLLDYGESSVAALDSLHHLCVGAMGINKRLWKKAVDKLHNCKIYSTYGMTEMSPRLTTLPSEDFPKKIGSVGLPLQGVEIIIDKHKDEEYGEILVKGRNLMLGYYGDSNKPIDKNGYFRTGDLGYLDDDGYLFIKGRLKNVIINNGMNIYPEEIENVLEQFPGIHRAYVYGEENSVCGEIPIAKIEVTKNICIKDVEEFCAKTLSPNKIPHRIMIVDNLQKNESGKIKRVQ